MRISRTRWVSALAAVVLLSACGVNTGEKPQSTAGASSDSSDTAQTEAGSDASGSGAGDGSDASVSRTAAPAVAGTVCGQHDGWSIVVARGQVLCAEARGIIGDYEGTSDIAPGGKPASEEDVAGWTCTPVLYAKHGHEPDTYSSRCEKGDAAIMTIDARIDLPVEGEIVDPTPFLAQGYGQRETQWAFASPSGSWNCGIIDNPVSDDAGLQTGVQCEPTSNDSLLPGTRVDSDGGPMPANGVVMEQGRAPYPAGMEERLVNPDGESLRLDYGKLIYARGIACTLDQDKGVTCVQPGHRFTASFGHGFQGA